MPVREALARVEPHQGIALANLSSWLLRPLPVVQRMAARGLARRPRRTMLTALTLALGIAFFMMSLNVRSSMLATVESVERTKPHDLEISFAAAYPEREIAAWLRDFPSIRGWEYWSASQASLYSGGTVAANPMTAFGVPADTSAIRPDVIAGRWLDATSAGRYRRHAKGSGGRTRDQGRRSVPASDRRQVCPGPHRRSGKGVRKRAHLRASRAAPALRLRTGCVEPRRCDPERA
jgi:hypothetical protein